MMKKKVNKTTLALSMWLPYIREGCSPIGMKKHFPTYIHHTASRFDQIYVSAGIRGLQIEIAPADLIKEAQAAEVDLIT